MRLLLRTTAVILAALSGAAFAERAATEAEARYYIYSALLTQAAPGTVADRVALGPELSKRWAMPQRGEGAKVYDTLVSLTDGKHLQVRKATAGEVAAYGARPGLHAKQPFYAVDAGELKLLVQYDLQANAISYVGERNTPWDAPKAPELILAAAAPAAAGATRPAPTRLSWTGLFAFDSAALTPQARATLEGEIVARLAAMDEILSVEVSGHADPLGPSEYNQRLSERRAAAVSDYLASRGVATGAMVTAGFGKQAPVKACRDDLGFAALVECLAPNRRVVVEIAATSR